MEVSILGGGRMAAAYTATLRSGGVVVSSDRGDLAPMSLLAFFSGKETLDFLDCAKIPRRAIFVDLATQGVADAQACARTVRRADAIYLAGGVTGGVKQVGSGDFMILVGGPDVDEALPDWMSMLGAIKTYPTVEQAVGAKLLHNLALVLINHALGVTLSVAQRAGIPDLLYILEKGTAGRPIREASAVRDRAAPPGSSYSSDLVAKDLRAMVASFPELIRLNGIDLNKLADCYAAYGSNPYTIVADRILSE